MAQIKLLQSAAQIYHFQEDKHIWAWFDSVRVFDENECHDLSCIIEPIKEGPARLKKKSASLGMRPSRPEGSKLSLLSCGLDNSSVCNSSITDSPSQGMSHSSSTSSLLSCDSDTTISSPFRSPDTCVVRVRFESGPESDTHVYKSIMLKNIDHTHTVIDKVLEKYSIKGPAGNYCLLQVLSDGELLIPDKGNVFYAMNKSDGSEPVFVVRTRQDQEARTQHRKRGRRKLKNWSL